MRHLPSLLALALSIGATGAVAQQSLATGPNGHVVIRTSPGDVTRVSITGDRIRRFVNDGSAYEMTNDEATGDAFLRFAGQGRPERETGFIITEKGITIGYTLEPKTGSERAETAILRITGLPDASSVAPAPLAAPAPGDPSSADSHAGRLAAFLRQVIDDALAGRDVPKSRDGSVWKTVTGPDLRARILVARAGAQGATLRQQSYYRPGVLAVWIDQAQLAPHGRSWVVVLEAGR